MFAAGLSRVFLLHSNRAGCKSSPTCPHPISKGKTDMVAAAWPYSPYLEIVKNISLSLSQVMCSLKMSFL